MLLAAYITPKIIKINVAPSSRAEVNQFDARTFTNESSNIPELSSHRLMTFSSGSFHHLKYDRYGVDKVKEKGG